MSYKIDVYKETITIEEGKEVDDSCVDSFLDDTIEFDDLIDVAKYLEDQGVIEASSSVFCKGIWYLNESEQDMYSGNYEQLSFILNWLSLEEEQMIYEYIIKHNKKAIKDSED